MARKIAVVQRDLGLRIQELRRAHGETQESLADRLGMLPSNYARLEQGRNNPTVETLHRVATALDVDLAEFFRQPTRKLSKPGRPRKDGS